MSAYTVLSEVRVSFDRGTAVQRSYNRLSVDFVCQNWIRTAVRGIKLGRKPLMPPLRRNLRLPLLRRFNESEVL